MTSSTSEHQDTDDQAVFDQYATYPYPARNPADEE